MLKVWDGLKALLNYSPWALVLSVLVVVLSVVDAFLAKKSGKEKVLKIIVAMLSVTLLLVQARSSRLASERQAEALQDALTKQRDDLTRGRGGERRAIAAEQKVPEALLDLDAGAMLKFLVRNPRIGVPGPG